MQYLIVSGNPKQDASFQSVLQEAARGAGEGGANVKVLALHGISPCKACGGDAVACKTGHHCAFGNDGFDQAQLSVRQADAFCFVALVQWDDIIEPMKGFLDRLRRCEHGLSGSLAGKPVLIVTVAEGTANGLLACLEQMDRFCRQTGAVIFDYLNVNRWNSDYQRASAYAAAKSMAYGRKVGNQTNQ